MTLEEQLEQVIGDAGYAFDPHDFDVELAAEAVVGLLRQGSTVRVKNAKMPNRSEILAHTIPQIDEGVYVLVLLEAQEP
ncbi:hypothetical protein LCGC14_0397160 [marine sediment metagenome]|uniref:Uncharacterized protein n=1 Tax=marine sediment metagenome TaxID=412755 RepID=A0A0F9W6Y2_9ZZZZ